MRPDWRPLEPGDLLYDAATEKWSADAYGVGAHDPLPDVGPDDHTASNGYWLIERIPPDNVIGSRFIATKAQPGAK